jgi:hypothetical protein
MGKIWWILGSSPWKQRLVSRMQPTCVDCSHNSGYYLMTTDFLGATLRGHFLSGREIFRDWWFCLRRTIRRTFGLFQIYYKLLWSCKHVDSFPMSMHFLHLRRQDIPFPMICGRTHASARLYLLPGQVGSRFTLLAVSGHQGLTFSTTQSIPHFPDLSEKNPLVSLPYDATIISLLEVFCRGTHRGSWPLWLL